VPTNKPKPIYREAIDKIADRIDDALVAAVHRMDENDDVDLDTIIVSLAEARAYLVSARIMAISADHIISIDVPNDRPRMYADELPEGAKPKALPLPPIKPQGHNKPKYKKGMAAQFKGAKDFDCPRCDAEAGTNCFKFDGPGAHPKLTDERNDGTFFHRQRQDLAKAYNDRIRKANLIT
jgi:hypothetical protein